MEIINELYEIIGERKKTMKKGSYTASLISGGEEKILRKVEEEAEEVIDAARTGTKEELVHEVADLLFHLLVLMGYKDVTPGEIEEELARRRK